MAAIAAADVRPRWQFAQFTEHALACAKATRSDAVMVGAYTAALQLPGWRWGPLEGLPQAVMTTWLVRQRQTRAVVQEVADVVRTVRPLDDQPRQPSASTPPGTSAAGS